MLMLTFSKFDFFLLKLVTRPIVCRLSWQRYRLQYLLLRGRAQQQLTTSKKHTKLFLEEHIFLLLRAHKQI